MARDNASPRPHPEPRLHRRGSLAAESPAPGLSPARRPQLEQGLHAEVLGAGPGAGPGAPRRGSNRPLPRPSVAPCPAMAGLVSGPTQYYRTGRSPKCGGVSRLKLLLHIPYYGCARVREGLEIEALGSARGPCDADESTATTGVRVVASIGNGRRQGWQRNGSPFFSGSVMRCFAWQQSAFTSLTTGRFHPGNIPAHIRPPNRPAHSASEIGFGLQRQYSPLPA